MGKYIEQAVKELTRASGNRIELTLDIIKEFTWHMMLFGSKCYWVAKLPIGCFFYVDEARTIKRSGQPDEYLIIKDDGKMIFRDEAQYTAMGLVAPAWLNISNISNIAE